MPVYDYPEAYHEYCETIFRLSRLSPDHLVSNLDIAKDLNIKPPSVSEMIAKLQESGLVEWEKRKGVKLTEQGLKLASRVIRNHVILKILFNKLFGVENDTLLERLACEIEHHLTGNVGRLMEEVLGTTKIDIENLKTDDLAFINKLDELRVINATKIRGHLAELTHLLDVEVPTKDSPAKKKLHSMVHLLLGEKDS